VRVNTQIRVLLGNYKTNINKNVTFVFSVMYCQPNRERPKVLRNLLDNPVNTYGSDGCYSDVQALQYLDAIQILIRNLFFI
jgi:hypothetical protein